jgi:signal transduction histidine kinase
VASAGLGLSLELDAVDELVSEPERMTVYRIAQECLTNTLKHAGATRLSLRLKHLDGSVLLVVEDDGLGFDVDQVITRRAGASGMGLATMAERTRMLGGRLDVHSSRGGGSRIQVAFPIAHPAERR